MIEQVLLAVQVDGSGTVPLVRPTLATLVRLEPPVPMSDVTTTLMVEVLPAAIAAVLVQVMSPAASEQLQSVPVAET
jgi:hypothetical protein